MRYAVVLVLAFCFAGGVVVGDDWGDCRKAFLASDYHAAVAPCTRLAELGLDVAQYMLGLMYYNGEGVPQDYAKAVGWYLKAAEQGHAEAQAALGYMYYNGEGAPQDYAKALYWRLKVAEQGDAMGQRAVSGMYFLGEGAPVNYKMAYYWANLAATLEEDPEQRKTNVETRDFLSKQLTPEDVSEAQRMASEWYEKFKARQGDK